jgi:hypothetical protein
MATIPEKPDSRRRLPECMRCVLDHLAPGLAPGPQALLIRYARHAHDPGCGITVGQRRLSRELRASPVTLRGWREELQDRGLIQRLPRAGPKGTDLVRIGPCDDCRQRDSMQLRCERCQRVNLQHAEPEWWAAQRDSMQSQKPVLQVVPTGTPVSRGGGPAAASPNGDGARGAPPPRAPQGRRPAADAAFKPSNQAREATGGAVLLFKADRPLPPDHGEPSTPRHVLAPSAATGDAFSNPGRLFESEAEQDPAWWAR